MAGIGASQTKRASIAPGNSAGSGIHTRWPLPGATRISAAVEILHAFQASLRGCPRDG
jgi:hypothetical protein